MVQQRKKKAMHETTVVYTIMFKNAREIFILTNFFLVNIIIFEKNRERSEQYE